MNTLHCTIDALADLPLGRFAIPPAMSEPKPAKVTLLPPTPSRAALDKESIRAALNDALEHLDEFSIVLVAAGVALEDGSSEVRVFSSASTRFERIGVLEDAKDAVLRD